MAEYFSPGVYVEEYDNSPRGIEGVGTSTAGFVGLAEKGPVSGAPVFVPSFKAFKQNFGGYLNEFTYGEFRYLANSVEQYFANGGTRCYVMRVAPEDAVAASAEQGLLTVKAKNPGSWGNKIQITLNSVKRHKIQLLEETDSGYKAKSVDGLREGDIIEFNGTYTRIKTIMDKTLTFEDDLPKDAVDANIIPENVLYVVTFDMIVRYGDDLERYTDLTFNPASPLYVGSKLAGSEIVDVEVTPMEDAGDPVEAILGDGEESGSFFLEDGADGSVSEVNAGTFIGQDNGPGKRTGLQAFVENNNVSMLAVPGVTIPEVVVSLVGHCENQKNRFAVIDMPKDYYKPIDLINYRSMIDSTYAAMYHPWIEVFDPSSNKADFVPPSGAIMGVYARTDQRTQAIYHARAATSMEPSNSEYSVFYDYLTGGSFMRNTQDGAASYTGWYNDRRNTYGYGASNVTGCCNTCINLVVCATCFGC